MNAMHFTYKCNKNNDKFDQSEMSEKKAAHKVM